MSDLPLLQDVDLNNDNNSDAWERWWNDPGVFDPIAMWREVHVVDAHGDFQSKINLTSNDLRDPANYATLREMIVDAATAERVQGSPWQNRVEPMDVNDDGFVVANDVLRIINRINSEGPGELPTPSAAISNYYDVTGDNFVSSLDALRIIRHINIHSDVAAAGEPDSNLEPAVSAQDADALFALAASDQDDEDDDGSN